MGYTELRDVFSNLVFDICDELSVRLLVFEYGANIAEKSFNIIVASLVLDELIRVKRLARLLPEGFYALALRRLGADFGSCSFCAFSLGIFRTFFC